MTPQEIRLRELATDYARTRHETFRAWHRGHNKMDFEVCSHPDCLLVRSCPRAETPTPDDTNRCAVCGWTLAESIDGGCIRGNGSMRPFPDRLYAPERANLEYLDPTFSKRHHHAEPVAAVASAETPTSREAFRAGFLAVCRPLNHDTPLNSLTRVWSFDGIAAADLEPEAFSAWSSQRPVAAVASQPETVDASRCGMCGDPYRFDTTIPSATWNAVVRAQGLPEYLCLNCIVKTFIAAKRSFTATLWGGTFNGEAISVEVELAAPSSPGAETPELPPRPPLNVVVADPSLPRYGIRWNGPNVPISVPMLDGLWTPWFLAQEAVARAAARPSAGQDLQTWQPIETAPKDGTTILVFKRTEPCWSVIGLAFWISEHGITGWMSYGIPQHSEEPNTLGLAHPTHWMPLPLPPPAERPDPQS